MADYKPGRSYLQLEMEMTGKWYECVSALAPALSGALATFPKHTQCPMHASKGDGLRLFKDFLKTGGCVCNTCGTFRDGFASIAWVNGWTRKDAVREVAKWLDGDSVMAAPIQAPKVFQVREKDPKKIMAKMRDVLVATKSIKKSAAQKYLENRGIWANNLPETIRFHPALSYWDKDSRKELGPFPAIVAPLKDKDGRIVALHRIYITAEGEKAPVPNAKKLMETPGSIAGAAIKLFPADEEILGVGEGIETMLAVRAITRMPVWACFSAVLLEQVHIPANVKHVVIWADLDKSGRGSQAASALLERLKAEGRDDVTVEVCFPDVELETLSEDTKGVDWLDVLTTQGQRGFPEKYRRWTKHN